MISMQAGPLAIACALAALCFLLFSIIRRNAVRARFERALSHAKPIAAILCAPAGFALMELPYNPGFLDIEPYFALVGIAVTGTLFAIVFFLGQRSRIAMGAFLTACFVAGTANAFVATFKGQPILPSDVMALQTAASVSAGYTYPISSSVLVGFSLLTVCFAVLVLMPRQKLDKRTVGVNLSAGAAILVAFCLWFSAADIEDDYGCTVDVWSSLASYQEHGSLLCFLQRSQLIVPKAPEGYTTAEAATIRAEKAAIVQADEAMADAPATAPDVRPAVVAIMNETFSDLSRYPNLEGYTGPTFFNAIDDALLKGDCYVSAMGGGTCNSEFEFLTGSSMGLLGAGVYPYMLYDLEGVDNLAGYLSSIGYATSAIHPAQKENWRRDRVYSQLDFDTFYDETAFEDAELFRGMVSDASTYDLILQLLEENPEPQFIFDVTIASHGGYDTGLIDEQSMVHVPVGGIEYADVNEYLSCIQRSDAELRAFLDALEALERPVVVCFFGDHQPGFVDWLSNEAYGADDEGADDETASETDSAADATTDKPADASAASDAGIGDAEQATDEEAAANDDPAHGMSSIELAQERYVTPYMIWTNSNELRSVASWPTQHDTSLNYLGATLLRLAGLPLDEYFAFTLAMSTEIPAINLNGYQDAEGTWHWHGEESDSSDAYRDLALVEHSNLFDKN